MLGALPDTRTVIDFSVQEKLLRKKQQGGIVAPTHSHCHLGAGYRASSLCADQLELRRSKETSDIH